MTDSLPTAKKQRGRPFVKGQSGNPNGRPRKTPELREVEDLCKDLSPMAVRSLAKWAKGRDPGAAVRACTVILERAFGKPTQPIDADMTIHDSIDRPPSETREQWLERKKRELATTPVQGHADG